MVQGEAVQVHVLRRRKIMSDREKDELAEQNMPLIWYVVNRYAGASVGFDELYSAALFGMAKAISTYDKSRGIRFSTFAVVCMNHEILNLLKVSRKRGFDISYDSCILSPDNGDVIRDESFIGRMMTINTTPDDVAAKIVFCDFVEQLPERDREILRLRMDGMQHKDIAKRFGVTPQRIGRLLIGMREQFWKELYLR